MDYSAVDGDAEDGGFLGLEVFVGVGVFGGRDDHLDSGGEEAREPEGDARLLVGGSLVDEMVDTFDEEDHAVIGVFFVIDDLFFKVFIAGAEPVGEVASEFFFEEFDFLVDIQNFLVFF